MIFLYEWKKNYRKKLIAFFIVAFSFLSIANIYYRYQSDSYFAYDNGWRTAYWELYDRFSGEITSEKLADLEALYMPLAEKTANMTLNTAINPDSMTGINEYSDYMMLDSYYVVDMKRFCAYAERAEGTALIAKENVALYNESGNLYQARRNVKIYNHFHGRRITAYAYTESYNRMTDYSFSSWMGLLICIYAASGSFARERETQMEKLLKTTPKGHGTVVCAKLAATLSFAFVVSIWFSFTDYCGFALVYGDMDAGVLPVYALTDFSFSMLDCTLWQYFLLWSFGRAIGSMLFTLLCCLLSVIFSTSLWPFLMGSVFTALSCLTANATQNAYNALWRVFNPAFLLYGKALYKGTEYLNVLGEPIAVPVAAFCWALILLGILFYCICHIYSRGQWADQRRF